VEGLERAKPEGLAYLEATATATATATTTAKATTIARQQQQIPSE
jgi:hypothetical protein